MQLQIENNFGCLISQSYFFFSSVVSVKLLSLSVSCREIILEKERKNLQVFTTRLLSSEQAIATYPEKCNGKMSSQSAKYAVQVLKFTYGVYIYLTKKK